MLPYGNIGGFTRKIFEIANILKIAFLLQLNSYEHVGSW